MECNSFVVNPLLTKLLPSGFMKLWVLTVLLLAACDTPSRAYKGVPASRVSVDESVFDIRINENRAEAIRINAEWAPSLKAIEPRAVAAIEQASGCKVKRLRGDQAMMIADLKCKGAPVPPAPVKLSCALSSVPFKGSGGEFTYDIDCTQAKP